MAFILNLIFGVLAFFIADYVGRRINIPEPIRVLLAVLIGIVVFFANFALQLGVN